MRKATSGITLSLLLIAMFEFAVYVEPAKTGQEFGLLLETDKEIYVLGEEIAITLTNIGGETVEIGGCPAWIIITYPEEEPVYPNIFATCIWWLHPEEFDTCTWNQRNETGSLVEPGMYVVRDTQGWGLSAYFKIIEEWVPCVPGPDTVDLVFWMANRKAYVNITITFGNPCVNISSWGTVVRTDHDISVNSEIWHWTGYCVQIILVVSHTYELGYLEPGNYTFTFKAWRFSVKSIEFDISADGPIPSECWGGCARRARLV